MKISNSHGFVQNPKFEKNDESYVFKFTQNITWKLIFFLLTNKIFNRQIVEWGFEIPRKKPKYKEIAEKHMKEHTSVDLEQQKQDYEDWKNL